MFVIGKKSSERIREKSIYFVTCDRCSIERKIAYSRVRNKRTPTFINFRNFFQGLRLRLKTLLHKFAHFKGLRSFLLSNFPEAMFIQGATSIPDSRVLIFKIPFSVPINKMKIHFSTPLTCCPGDRNL